MANIQDEDHGALTIAMTPVQLAALINDLEAPESASLSNRIWGGVTLLGGVLELVGAGVLCVAPEPTMASKVGCVILGAHGSDTAATGLRQVWTGLPQRSATSVTAGATAQALGASRETADNIALAVDVAVPLVVASGVAVARVIAVRSGRLRFEAVRLAEHEAVAGSRVGGHTIRKHVAQTDAQMLDRANATNAAGKAIGPKAVSTFSSMDVAEQAISATLRARARDIAQWSRTASPGATQEFEHVLRTVVGRGVQRSSQVVHDLRGVRVVLKMQSYNGKPFYILTAHPI